MSHEHSDAHLVDRREYLELTGGIAAAATVGFAGCTSAGPTGDDSGPTATGYLATQVTDQPTDIDDFESCVVTIQGIWMGPRSDGADEDDTDEDESAEEDADDDAADEDGESTSQAVVSGAQAESAGQGGNQTTPDSDDEDEGGEVEADGDDADDGAADEDGADDADGDNDDDDDDEGDGSGGRTYLAFDEPQTADLVELQDDSTQLVDDREVDVGTYRFLQLDVDGVDGVLNDGSEATVETPGNAPLKFQTSFEVREDTRTTFTADFAPVRRGDGSYLIKPVATGTTVSYGSAGDGEDADSAETDTSDGDADDEEEDGDESGAEGDGAGENATATGD